MDKRYVSSPAIENWNLCREFTKDCEEGDAKARAGKDASTEGCHGHFGGQTTRKVVGIMAVLSGGQTVCNRAAVEKLT